MTPCVLVLANSGNGYRRVRVGGGRKVNAARLALEASLGRPLGPGMVPDHLCGTRNCVNPAHLEEVTLAENTRRAQRLGDNDPCPQGHVGQFRRGPTQRACRECKRQRARRA